MIKIMKLLVFPLPFRLKRLRGMNNMKNNNKYNNTNTRQITKCNTKSNRILKGKNKTNGISKMKIEREQ